MADPDVKAISGYQHDPKRASQYVSSDGLFDVFERWFTSPVETAETNVPARGTTMLTSVGAGVFNPKLVAHRVLPMGDRGSQAYVVLTFRRPRTRTWT